MIQKQGGLRGRITNDKTIHQSPNAEQISVVSVLKKEYKMTYTYFQFKIKKFKSFTI